jgi:hypothetical protein
MSKLNSMRKEFIDNTLSYISSYEQFNTVWKIQQLMLRANARRLLTPEVRRFCDKQVKDKILQEENLYVGILLHEALVKIQSYLDKMKYRHFIYAYVSSDSYLPDWEGITILVKVPYRTFREKMKIWREIENQITQVFDLYRERNLEDIENIDEANEIIATDIEKLNS